MALHGNCAIDEFHVFWSEWRAARLALDSVHLNIAREVNIEGDVMNRLLGSSS